MIEKRKSPRAPILTQVEAQGERLSLSALGRSSNISLGGLLIETPDTLPEGANAVIRFFLPPGTQPIEAAGRVVRVEPGKSMAVAFLGLAEKHRKLILDYIENVQGGLTGKLIVAPSDSWVHLRRSGRLARRLAVMLSWQGEDGRLRQEAAETLALSQHGAQIVTFGDLQPAQLVRIALPETARETSARIVWVAGADVPGKVKAGLEVLGSEDFWGVEFPVDQLAAPEGPRIARRRSARLPRRVDVLLSWREGPGVREVRGQTLTVSQHGAALTTGAALAEKQQLRLRAPWVNREAESRVIWVRSAGAPGGSQLGVEFLEGQDFWGVAFPADPGSALP